MNKKNFETERSKKQRRTKWREKMTKNAMTGHQTHANLICHLQQPRSHSFTLHVVILDFILFYLLLVLFAFIRTCIVYKIRTFDSNSFYLIR